MKTKNGFRPLSGAISVAIRGALTAVISAAFCASALAQTYPSRPVRMLLGYPSGGGMDSIARVLGQKLSEGFGQQVVIENRPGASGMIGAEAAAKAVPDGYTLFLADTGFLITPSVMANPPADPYKSFTPVASICSMTLVFVVPPDSPIRSTQELIATLKANPGKYAYGSIGVGTVHHFAFELFKRAEGLDVLHVPYKGAPPMVPDLISGRIPVGVLSLPVVVPQARAGKMRALAVTTAQRTASVADWPTIAETLPGFSASPRIFLLAPAGTPAAIIARLNEATNKLLALKDVQENLARQGATPTPATPEFLGAEMASEGRRWGAIAREAGIKSE